MVNYIYDAWGNNAVTDKNGNEITAIDHIGNINPFRYRGYYYDTETELYYLQTRYYDPELGRFISQDSVEYADPETINGLNLYAYCGNNPINFLDPTGNAAWWQWMLFGIGVALVVAAAVVLSVVTGGAATTLIGAIAIGAAKGAIIGACAGSAIGIAGGAIYSAKTGANLGESILSGFLIGFGGGAIVGAIVGGVIGANGWYNAKALEFTHYPESSEVVLGRSGTYEALAESKKATYFKMPDTQWNALSKHKHIVWQINKAFLKQQAVLERLFCYRMRLLQDIIS